MGYKEKFDDEKEMLKHLISNQDRLFQLFSDFFTAIKAKEESPYYTLQEAAGFRRVTKKTIMNRVKKKLLKEYRSKDQRGPLFLKTDIHNFNDEEN